MVSLSGSAADPAAEGLRRPLRVDILEGMTVQPTPAVAGAQPVAGRLMRAVVQGVTGALRFDDEYLSKHLLFLGGIGTGKTNAMMHVVSELRRHADEDDVFVVFDSKGDFLLEFYRDGDAVISNDFTARSQSAVWNVFSDVGGADHPNVSDEIFEVASTIFGDELAASGQNMFFAVGARDVFAAVFEALLRDEGRRDNSDLRHALERSTRELWDSIREHPDLAGSAIYLTGAGETPEAVRAFLQQGVNTAFSGIFRESGNFSIRDFVRRRGGRALFVEYDIATGSRLTPVYRILIDLAIKEALTLGRAGIDGNVYFVMDEFSLVPRLQHMSDGINFGRSLHLKFIAGTQNVEQVLFAYGPELGRTILSGFGTVFGFRLMDEASRNLIRQRFGANRKQITTDAVVRAQGVHQETVLGNVVEDWVMSSLGIGECVACLPNAPPFYFKFAPYRNRK